LVVKAMHRTKVAFGALVSWFASACAASDRPPLPLVDCSVEDAYEFLNISNFTGGDSQWFQYADATPGGVPDTRDVDAGGVGSNVEPQPIDPPRCGDIRGLKLEMAGHNFWGGGFGDYGHNEVASRADGTGYEGISFWARSPAGTEKQFIFNVDDGRTIVLNTAGYFAGDVIPGTRCRLPPPEAVAGDVSCYNGGVDSPASGGVRVPESNECGNAFHTRITTTETWQLFRIPWNDLVQWPCPNRLDGGIDRTDIGKFEIKFMQGTRYEIWLDNIAFYRARAD
jgi:hypothetical protein